MKIISHRGAAGLETENTLEALLLGVRSGANRVEFDVWTSKDGVPIVFHDASFYRLCGIRKRVFDLTSTEISKIRTRDGKKIITAKEALVAMKGFPVFLEIKDLYLSDSVIKLLQEFKDQDIWVSSNNQKVVLQLGVVLPEVKLFASTILHPLETLRLIRKKRLHGLALHYVWFNVLVYLYCKRHGIKLVLYTVNNKLIMKHFSRFYPDIILCTDYPNKAMEFIRPSDRDIRESLEQPSHPRR